MPWTDDPHPDKPEREEEEVSGQDIFRVVIFTLLILLLGFLVIGMIGFLEVADEDGIPDTDQIQEWVEKGMASLPNSLKLMTMLVQMSLIIPAWLYLRSRRYTVSVHLRFRRVPLNLLFYALLIGPSIAVIGDELSRLFGLVLPMPAEQVEGIQRVMTLNNAFDYLTVGLTVVIIAPVIEEALFRGFFQRWFERNRGVTSGVLAASALFALYHFNIYWLVPILLMATILGALAWRAESVWPSIIVHSSNNLLGLVAANVGDGSDPEWYSFHDHVHPLILLAAVVVITWSLRRFFALAEQLGMGGHGPSGGSGTKIDTTA